MPPPLFLTRFLFDLNFFPVVQTRLPGCLRCQDKSLECVGKPRGACLTCASAKAGCSSSAGPHIPRRQQFEAFFQKWGHVYRSPATWAATRSTRPRPLAPSAPKIPAPRPAPSSRVKRKGKVAAAGPRPREDHFVQGSSSGAVRVSQTVRPTTRGCPIGSRCP